MLPRIMGEIANVSDPLLRRLRGRDEARADKLNARLMAPDSAATRADAEDGSREAEPAPTDGRVETADTDSRDNGSQAPRLPTIAAASGSSDERLHASESLAATTDAWLRDEIARRERALAELEAFRARYDGIATDQAGLLKAEGASRKAAQKRACRPARRSGGADQAA